MQLKTILNRIEPFKSFVYTQAQMIDDGEPTDRSRDRAASQRAADLLGLPTGPARLRSSAGPRRFEYVPLWGMAVSFLYAMRRVNCPACGVKVEQVPWVDGKCHLTTSYRWFLARWAKRLSWKEVADVFHTTWENVFRAVKYAVFWGLVHRDMSGIEAIGVDEIQWSRGHKYLTLVYQIDDGLKRLLWIGGERTEESLRGFFQLLTDNARTGIRFVCSDMWKPYLKVIREELGQAVHVLDRFHLMKKMNEAIDQVRREEVRATEASRLRASPETFPLVFAETPGEPDRPADGQTSGTDDAQSPFVPRPSVAGRLPAVLGLRQSGLGGQIPRRVVSPNDAIAAGANEEGRNEPCDHRSLILNWFRARGTISAGTVEGLNNKAKLTTRKAFGFRTLEAVKIALYHTLGALPEPQFTHEFC